MIDFLLSKPRGVQNESFLTGYPFQEPGAHTPLVSPTLQLELVLFPKVLSSWNLGSWRALG